MRHSYATLDDIRRWNEATYADPAIAVALDTEDYRLMALARQLTDQIDHVYTQSTFMPIVDTRYYDSNSRQHISKDGLRLFLYYPLVSLSSATLADDTALTVGTNVFLKSQNAIRPAKELRILNSSGYNWYIDGGNDWQDGIVITGTWCNRSYYDTRGWLDSGQTVQDNPMNDSTTTLTVTNADAVNNVFLPVFSIGNLIRVESEYMVVTNVNEATNVLTVERGVRGTTAAAHIQDTQIDVFQVEPSIVKATAMATVYQYSRIGKTQQVTVEGNRKDRQSYPADIPDAALNILRQYTMTRFEVI